MSTEKQIEANRENAQKAGVKTQEGKEIVRHNAYKHGLTAKALLGDFSTISESLSDFEQILDGLKRSFSPKGHFENDQIEQMAKATFKLRRFDVWEKHCFKESEELNDSFKLHKKFGIAAFTDLELALKYKASLEGQYYRALEAFLKSRQCQQLNLFHASEPNENE